MIIIMININEILKIKNIKKKHNGNEHNNSNGDPPTLGVAASRWFALISEYPEIFDSWGFPRPRLVPGRRGVCLGDGVGVGVGVGVSIRLGLGIGI